MTANMLRALEQAAKQDGLRRVHDDQPGRPPWPAPPATIHALVRHGLVSHAEIRNRRGFRVDIWRVTDAGRCVLDPPPRVRRDPRRSMRGGTVTMLPTRGTFVALRCPEPEKIDPAVVEGLPSSLEARQRHAIAVAERGRDVSGMTLGQWLDTVLAEARRNRIDTSKVERLAARKIVELERRTGRAA